MDLDITNTDKVGRTFSMLHNRAMLARMDSSSISGGPFEPEKMAALERSSNAMEQVDDYAAKFVASGAHLEREHNAHALPDPLREAIQPVDEYIDREFRHRTGGPANAFERQQLVDYFDQYATDRDTIYGLSPFSQDELRELDGMLPAERRITENPLQLLQRRETGDGLAGAKLKLRFERDAAGEDRPALDADGFDALPQALVNFRSRLEESVREQEPLFSDANGYDEGLHGPRVDWQAVARDPQARQQAIARLDGAIAAMEDPQVMRVDNKQQERRAAVQSFGEGMDFNDGTRSPPPGGNDGEPQSKRPRLDDRDRSRATLGL